MILDSGQVVRCQYSLGKSAKTKEVVVFAESTEAAHREVILHAGSSEDYDGEDVNILSTEILWEADAITA